MIARFLAGNWHWLLACIAAAAAWGYALVALEQRDAALAERDTALTKVSVLSAQIESQNRGIRALEAAAEANREVYLAGLDAANRRAVKLEISAADYLAMPTPADPEEACAVADQILEGVTR